MKKDQSYSDLQSTYRRNPELSGEKRDDMGGDYHEFYNLEDDELNHSDPDENENDDNKENDGEDEYSVPSAFLLLLRILISPIEGWKKLRRSRLTVENIQSSCFYPILAILAISKFVNLYYIPKITLSEIVIQATVVFVSFFFGYFCIILFLRNILPKGIGKQFEESYGKEYIFMGLSSFAFFSIFIQLLPMLWPILIFLPIWTIFILCKGIKFFKFPSKGILTILLVINFSVIGIPIGIDWLLNFLISF